MNVSSEKTLPIDSRIELLKQRIAALRLCVGNEWKIQQREQELAELQREREEKERQ